MMPWEQPPECTCVECVDAVERDCAERARQDRIGELDIPACIRRDANNKAPFMDTIIGGTNFCGRGVMAAICPTCKPSPANNPPATTPNWLPPWASKS